MSTTENDFSFCSDRTLVSHILSGDVEVIAFMFTHWCHDVFNPLVLAGCPTRFFTTEEACNFIYKELSADNWRLLRQFDFRCSLRSWFYANSLRVLLRNSPTERNRFTRKSAVKFKNIYADAIDSKHKFENDDPILIRRQLAVIIAASRELGGFYRALIQLRGLQGMTAKEVARILDRSSTAIDQGYMRAKRELYDLVEMKYKKKGSQI